MKKIMFNDKFGLTQAVLEGRKTKTRRIIKDKTLDNSISRFGSDNISLVYSHSAIDGEITFAIMLKNEKVIECIRLKYKLGEVVAVAQAYKDIACGALYDDLKEFVSNRKPEKLAGWTNKMFVRADLMPYHIRITDVRVEKLQDISDEDCLAEGIIKSYVGIEGNKMDIYRLQKNDLDGYMRPRDAYAALIDKISGKGTWQSNPYVFVYEFELVD